MSEQDRQDEHLVEVILNDHRALERSFQDYENGGHSDEKRRDLVDHILTELVQHSVAEEQYMYPAARRRVPGGDEIVEHEIHEHATAESVMKEVERLDPQKPDFDRRTRELIADIRHHVRDEEQDLLPRLRQACSDEELRELGRQVLAAKDSAPTRPHPATPDTPPANTIVDTGAGMIDRMRDALSGRKH